MRGRARAWRTVVELARMGFHVFSKFLERFRGYVCPDHREQRSVGEQGDRIERGQRIVTEVPEHVRRHGIDGRRPEQQGVAVGCGAHDVARAYGPVCARLALHDKALAEARFDSGGYRAEYRFRDASGGKWNDHANGLAGPVLGEAHRGPKCKQPGGEECENLSHGAILYWEDRCPATSSALCSCARGTSAARRPPRQLFEG